MIIVNTPGNREAYRQLDHAEWNGCTMTDLVFPFFLFIVGVSLAFSFSKRLGREGGAGLPAQILKRTLILFACGMALNAIPNYHPSTIRILGVLQRIALCYCLASFIFIKTTLRTQIAIAIGPRGLLAADDAAARTRLRRRDPYKGRQPGFLAGPPDTGRAHLPAGPI